MTTEYEIKFPKININEIKKKLENLEATLVMDKFLYKRYICDISNNSFMRLRTTPNGASLTIKEFTHSDKDHMKEQEMFINDFDEGKMFMDYFIKHDLIPDNHPRYQENYRTMYKLKDCEFCIDEWPLLEPFLELEAANETILKKYSEILGLEWKNGLFGSVNVLAKKLYNTNLSKYRILTFEKQVK